jgi:CRISPR-associated protein Cst1
LVETQFEELSSVTAYWLSNSGQGPAIDIIQVPGIAVRFLARLSKDPYRTPWLALVSRGWKETDEGKSKKKLEGVSLYGPGRTRNSVLNEIMAVFEGGFVDVRAAAGFVRRRLLWQAAGKTAPESWNALSSWTLTDCFAEHLLGMTQERLTRIREFADRLAQFVQATNDRQFLREVLYGEKEWHVRNALVKAQRRSTKSSLLFGLDDYVEVFMADDGMGRESWGLIRDLVVIRLVETLHTSGYFGDKSSLLEEPAASEDAA